MRTKLFVVFTSLLASGCPSQSKPTGSGQGPDVHTRRDLELSAEQEAQLAELAAAADRNPTDFAALEASGIAHMNLTLAGVLSLRDRAEQDLEAAFALDPTNPTLNRSLGRFYNLRAVAGDFSKADQQVRVYRALLGEQSPETMSDSQFVAYCFSMLGQVLTAKNRGRSFAALELVETLERQLAERVQQQPDNVEIHALAGNFAFFFAGNIPFGRENRVREGVAYFEHVRANWDRIRIGARDPEHCPNTYENFMFELAEGLLVLERPAEAEPIYTELTTIEPPRTRAKELIAHVSAERLRNLDAYVGEIELMPPWPSDVGNCVVCHAWTSDVPLDSLYSLEPIRLSDVPSKATYKPTNASANAVVPETITALLTAECSPCHVAGGEVVDMLDVARPEDVIGHAVMIGERITAGEMPPDQPLSESEQAAVRAWIAELRD